jgi:membrane protein
LNFSSALKLLKDSFIAWQNDNAWRLGAALAYFTIFSLAPLLLIIISIASFILGNDAAQGKIVSLVDFVLSFGVTTLLFAFTFKILPNAFIKWRDVWIGSAVISFLFTIGKIAIGFYLGNSAIGSTFGAAGSLVIIMLWAFYSAQILLFGVEFTKIYANRFGSNIRPDKYSVRIKIKTEEIESKANRTDR